MDLFIDNKVSEENTAYMFRAEVSEDEDSVFFRNYGFCVRVHTSINELEGM